jgi:NitT/TauT family transport system substrate-binding protein
MNKFFLYILVSLLLTACSLSNQKEILIATKQWIGYTPLYYAYEKGYLKKFHIQIINTVSLAEAADLFKVGKADMVTTTQHEYNTLRDETHNIVPVILLDRSNGGDMVLSNRSITQLQKSNKIYAYLEIDSINQEIIKDFIKNNMLDINKFVFINKDQEQIQSIDFQAILKKDKDRDIVIVTYIPYNIALQKRGFKEVASTKSIDSIIVIDALCATKNLVKNDKVRLVALKKILDRSIDEINKNPNESYKVTKKYLSNISYAEYLQALQNIKWINKPSDELLEFISQYHYERKNIIK